MSSQEITILGLAGSLRRASFNRALLGAAATLTPAGVRIVPHGIGGLPLYDGDLDNDDGPAPVAELKAAIAAADAVLWVTPEYNYGTPAPLKNALDWASRPGYRSVLAHKPAGVIGASMSATGTARAQGQLKQSLLGVLSVVYPAPEVLVAAAHERFDAEGALTDAPTEKVLRAYLVGFSAFVRGMRQLREQGVYPPKAS